MTVKVYKYRGVGNLDRDIKSLIEDCFFAPSARVLNDPTEVVINDKLVATLAGALSSDLSENLAQLTKMRHLIGIYSLSRTVTDELMWSHYADSHAGFCIEYDLERLILGARGRWEKLDVVYSERPPRLAVADFIGRSSDNIIAKLVGHKSLRWNYENELRIITPESGISYYERSAVSGIYFGCRCSNVTERKIRNALKNRDHQYSRMRFPDFSYQLQSIGLQRSEELDGKPSEYLAPIEDLAIMKREQLGQYADLYDRLLEAVQVVRCDSSCKKIINADVSLSGPKKGKIFVQYETTVPFPGLYSPPVTRYFD